MGPNIILAMGAIVIFGMFLSSSNRLMTGNTQIAEQNEYYISAISLAQSVIDEAKAKAFDQNTVSGSVPSPVALTLPGNLGPDGGESVSKPDTISSATPYTSATSGFRSSCLFNDLDDYAGYSRLVNTPRAEGFTVKVSVNYASSTYPDSSKAVQTYCKKMSVFVTSPFMSDTVKLYYAFTY